MIILLTINIVRVLGSVILSSEPLEISDKLREWLPKTGNWTACWRATRDGWNVETTFHPKCDGRKPTLTIVKVVKDNKNYIFGGYATESWDGNYFRSAPGSFIFSLRNKDNLAPFKAPLKKQNYGEAIASYSFLGPTFGGGGESGGNHDLTIYNNADSHANSKTDFGVSYQAPSGYSSGSDKTRSLLAGSYRFGPSEVEVLHLSD